MISFAAYAQDDTPLEFDEEGIEINPDSAAPTEVVEEAKAEDNTEEMVPEPDAVIEESKTTDNEDLPKEPVEEVVAPSVIPKPQAGPQIMVSETEVDEKKSFKAAESHWYSTFGFEAMEYGLPFEYDGEKKDFSETNRQLYGGRLGFGGEIYLGAGFLTSTRVEGYYVGTLFESAKTADPELTDEDVATIKDTGQLYGVDVVQTLSFIWELKTKNPIMEEMTYLTIEPFIEAGVGKGWAFNKKDYNYDTDAIEEEYDQSFSDELTNVKFGGGFNLTSRQGFFFFMKAIQNRYDITRRRTKGYFYRDGGTRTDVDPSPSTDLEPMMVYSLGGGYKF
jgi:hypothetical protein